jgi:hypothetical protein
LESQESTRTSATGQSMGSEDAELRSIRDRYVTADPFVLSSLSGAIRRIEESFPRFGHFVMEFIQNADDAGAHALSISQTGSRLLILNDGEPFKSTDITSLCQVGRSSKQAGDSIGYLGVGFKSVFLISDRVRVTSGGYSFGFDKAVVEARWGDRLPWQLIPLEAPPLPEVRAPWSTGFEISLENSGSDILHRLRSEVAPDELRPRVILFLKTLNRIEIQFDLDPPLRRVVERAPIQSRDSFAIYGLSDAHPERTLRGRYAVFRKRVQVPGPVQQDPITIRFDRQGVNVREVIAAFRVDDQNLLVPEDRGTAHMAIFSFLPLRDVATGLRFTIQADFLTGPGRSSLQNDALWNRWIASEVLGLIRDTCVPAFLADTGWVRSFPAILYSPPGSDPIFEKEIAGPLRGLLQNQPWFLSADGSHVSLNASIIISAQYRDWFSPADLALLYPGRKLLHEDIEPIPELGGAPSWIRNEGEFWEQTRRLYQSKARQQDAEWFKRLYQRQPPPPGGINGLGALLTDRYELVWPRDLHVLAPGVTLPELLRDQVKLAHPVLADSQWRRNLPELSTDRIAKLLELRQVPQLKSAWPALPPEEKTRRLGQLFELWKTKQVDAPLISFVTLPTKTKGWLPPARTLFSAEYGPGHSLEALEKAGLFETSCAFLDSVLASGLGASDLAALRTFLEALGVDSDLEEHSSQVSQRIGVKFALRYEIEQGRQPTELPESSKPGYDIDSADADHGELLHIEVKGSNDPEPDIRLTVNELRALNADAESYRIYVVSRAWTAPELSVVEGKAVFGGAMDYSIAIPFSKWSKSRSGPFRVAQ